MRATIRTRDDLERLRPRRARSGLRGIEDRLTPRGPATDRAMRRLHRSIGACGCTHAALAAAVAIASWAGWFVGGAPLTAGSAGLAFALVLAAALVGKVAGLVLAEYAVRSALATLLGEMPCERGEDRAAASAPRYAPLTTPAPAPPAAGTFCRPASP